MQALDGGRVELPALTSISVGAVDFLADGSGSTIDLSALESHTATIAYEARLRAVDGGVILLDDVYLAGVTVSLDRTSTIEVSELTLGPAAQLAFKLPADQDNEALEGGSLLTFENGSSVGLELDSAYTPVGGDRFELLPNWSNRVEAILQYYLPELSPGLAWNVADLLQDGTITMAPAVGRGDFDANEVFDCEDVNALVATIAAGSNDALFDLDADGLVNGSDLSLWLLHAGVNSLHPGARYLPADANLDGNVDVSDFNIWNANKFTHQAAWCLGDFNADGFIDVSDFNIWNANKFRSSRAVAAVVPEPQFVGLLALGVAAVMTRACRRRPRHHSLSP